MKSKYITTIILEGANGVGKSEAILQLFKLYNYRYMVYHRGEMSNLLYANKYNRPFSQTQCGLPFLHILLICDKKELEYRIKNRGQDVKSELDKINEQDEFIKLAEDMKNDYHILILDTTNLSIEEVGLKLKEMIDNYVNNLKEDETLSEWNVMYDRGCKKLGIKFAARDNQLYFNNILTMSEYTLQNGVYETYTNKSYPDNLIFMMGYSDEINLKEKDLDFSYVINSKILKRPEVYEYYKVWSDSGLKFLTSDNDAFIKEYNGRVKMNRVFGDDFIKELSRAKATVYTSRDLASRKLQTARLYESIRAQEIVFVDKLTDKDNEILNQIYDDKKFIELLSVTPETIVDKYNYVIKNNLTGIILDYQNKYYKRILKVLKENKYYENK